jgi:hypothetical protein
LTARPAPPARGIRRALLTACLAIVAVGCARVDTHTAIRTDGSFTRTVVLQGTAAPEAPAKESANLAPTLESLIAPPRGPSWTVTRERRKQELVITARRELAAGEALSDDIGVRRSPETSEPLIGNTAVVERHADGSLEYREVLRWRDAVPKQLSQPAPELLTSLKQQLPAAVIETDRGRPIRRVALRVQRHVWRLVFGPGDPLLGTLLAHPGAAERRLLRSLRREIDAALAAELGDALDGPTRIRAAQAIASAFAQTVQKESQPSSSAGTNSRLPVALQIRVSLPGAITESNGDQDDDARDVAWSLYPEAVAAGEITLRAVCAPPPR